MSTPRLHVFAISHFCEKARFALDHLGVAYQLVHEAPGLHMLRARRLGASGTTLPILACGAEVVQGSGEIIDWAESRMPEGPALTPAGTELAKEARAIEHRLDTVAAVHTRRLFYSEALVEHPETVKPVFTRDLDPLPRLALHLSWGLVRRRMISGMDLGRAQGEESRRILEGELDWLDGLLADGRRYLVADRFTRADLSAASLLARLAGAQDHPQARSMQMPPRLAALQREWSERPALVWIRGLYREHRPRARA